MPPGFENLYTVDDLIHALNQLKSEHPEVRKAVLKLNEGFSGDGNAVYKYQENKQVTSDSLLNDLKTVAEDLSIDLFLSKMASMGGVLEAFIDGDIKTSPSVQCVINPLKEIEIASTHDQILGGESGQVYLGARFPADPAYRKEIGVLGYKVAAHMATLGVLGRFGVDFVSVKKTIIGITMQ